MEEEDKKDQETVTYVLRLICYLCPGPNPERNFSFFGELGGYFH
jgi:hypothetical protein